jgi:hypothetical protein
MKTVKYNGENTRVTFENIMLNKEVVSLCKFGYPNHYKGESKFTINNKDYIVNWENKKNETWSIVYEFEGFKCGDSHKKMIEFIISKYGLK